VAVSLKPRESMKACVANARRSASSLSVVVAVVGFLERETEVEVEVERDKKRRRRRRSNPPFFLSSLAPPLFSLTDTRAWPRGGWRQGRPWLAGVGESTRARGGKKEERERENSRWGVLSRF